MSELKPLPLSEAAIDADRFAAERRANLQRWPTGAAIDTDEVVGYLSRIPAHKQLALVMRAAHRERRCLTQPRGGHRVAGAPGIYVRLDDPFSHAALSGPQPPDDPFRGLGKIAALGVSAQSKLLGRRQLRVGGQCIIGWAVRLGGLSLRDSLVVQTRGLGGKRGMGCGVFVPLREATGQEKLERMDGNA